MFHGKLAAGAVEYYAGAFNARRELEPNTASTPEGYVRLRFSPFKSYGPEALKNFSFGGAFADGRHRGDSSFVGRTASRSVTFFRAVPVSGEIVRANAEFWWRYKKFSLRGEYDQTHQSREGLGADGTNLPGVIGKGLVLQTTYLLTGEEKTETGITPKTSFLGGERGLGAWELAFRYENLQMHDSTNPNRGEAFTFGVNWWLTKFVRYQSNFALERFKDPSRAATPGDTSHFAYLSRMQVIF
jgi:phosphate-selective porin